MSFLLCGSEGGFDKENIHTINRSKVSTPQCFSLKMIPESMEQTLNMDTITLVIKRGKSGYGFSVTGSCPAKVKRVEEGSTSQLAGLCKEDCVVRINGQNVSRSIADSVAKIVRQSEKQIVLDIERESKLDRPQGQTNSEGQAEQQISELPHSAKMSVRKPLTTIKESPNENNIPEQNQIVCTVDIEPMPKFSSLESLTSLQLCQDHLIDIGDWESPHSPQNSFPSSLKITFRDLSEGEQERQSTIQRLVQCERDFLSQMGFGIQRYSNPLRHNIISPAEHTTLFQNVEKLVALSEYHVYKLTEESVAYSDVGDDTDKFIDIIGSIYLPKVLMMTEVFEQYCNGIKNSFRLLAELKEFKEFEEFLEESNLQPNQPSISGFIQKPLEHIKNLVLSLQKVLSLTPLDHQDTDNLSQVVETLRNTCNRINESNTRRSRSMTSLVSRSSSRSSAKSSRSSTKQARSSSSSGSVAPSVLSSDSSASSIESCVDPEVMEVQKRLVFCEHVQTFQVATATRHMIYAGDLMHVDGLLCTKLYVVLLSDLILLTKLEPDERLLVVDYPILLQDISETDFRDSETLDFCITVESGIDDEWVEERDITLRAPSMEQKYTWKNLLEQRTQSRRIQQDFLNMDNFV